MLAFPSMWNVYLFWDEESIIIGGGRWYAKCSAHNLSNVHIQEKGWSRERRIQSREVQLPAAARNDEHLWRIDRKDEQEVADGTSEAQKASPGHDGQTQCQRQSLRPQAATRRSHPCLPTCFSWFSPIARLDRPAVLILQVEAKQTRMHACDHAARGLWQAGAAWRRARASGRPHCCTVVYLPSPDVCSNGGEAVSVLVEREDRAWLAWRRARVQAITRLQGSSGHAKGWCVCGTRRLWAACRK